MKPDEIKAFRTVANGLPSQSLEAMSFHSALDALEAQAEELKEWKRWAKYCRNCAMESAVPMTREQFESTDAKHVFDSREQTNE